MEVEISADFDLNIDSNLLFKELNYFTNYKNTFNKYDVLYDEYDYELSELNNYEDSIKKTCDCFTYFENIENDLKKINELDKNTKEKIVESSKITKEIVDKINMLKKEKYNIRKKEKIYNMILQEYSLSSLCLNNLTDLKISLNIEFFEYLRQFEYTKKNIIKLLNEDSSDKLNKFYSKYYNKILNSACKKMCLYIIKENNILYKRTNQIIDLLLCTNCEEKEKRKIIIKNYIEKLSPTTKFCYKVIIERIEYFNICLSNFLHFRKKLLKKNYQELMINKYKSMNKKKSIEVDAKDDSIQIFKNFFSILYYLITLEDNFFKMLLSFNFCYANKIASYISINLENTHNILYNIIDVLLVPYKNFLETNLNIYPKSYESCYELFQVLDIFIFKLRQFQKNYEINRVIREIVIEYSTKDIVYNSDKNKDNNTNKLEILKSSSSFFQSYELTLEKRSSPFLCDISNNIIDVQKKELLNETFSNENNEDIKYVNTIKKEKGNLNENFIDKKNENYEIKEYNIIDREKKEIAYKHSIHNNENDPSLHKPYKYDSECSNKNINNTTVNERNVKIEVSYNCELNDKISSLEKYNCKLLNYTLNIQKNIENEFITLWQQNVVTFYLSKITKREDSDYFNDTLFYIKKIFNSLNNIHKIYKNSSLCGKSNEQDFQNVLDITINPLINNALKNKNKNIESDHIFIINIFTFIQESIQNFEGSSKYCELLTIIINEKCEKILETESSILMNYLNIDKMYKIDKLNENNTEEIEIFVENFYKFVFTENYNNFNLINKIESNDLKNNIKSSLFHNIHKEYMKIYELYGDKMKFNYSPEQIKDVLLKNFK
ncbi:conserved Plasmodium protein, unknown function [Plasmodium relictum]|uniref:Conserved Oligomeric Golgi complex subunit 6 C-terminal domain-containing protein n=1 Tax=Plasmodium relictum TaxID=85471 RepID=A0A1J1HCG8_PLARL|nr:conserved Plasmodium protein, unknown function [Plasmodium relictum]CRH01273.1 conserved Plasmodium protein, unknown function [Plasmodium relictum]